MKILKNLGQGFDRQVVSTDRSLRSLLDHLGTASNTGTCRDLD